MNKNVFWGSTKPALFKIAGYATLKDGSIVPVLDIPMMTDEEWNEKAAKQAAEREEERV